jgi:hypothetical protein
MAWLGEILQERRLAREFRNQAQISSDGKTITLAGYTAKRDDSHTLLPWGLKPSWDITMPAIAIPGYPDAPPLPGNRIVHEGGVWSARTAINIMARCAAAHVMSRNIS